MNRQAGDRQRVPERSLQSVQAIRHAKRAQRAFAFDDITIVPSRRTRGEEEVSLQWRIDAYTFAFPLIAAPMDSVMSPATAIKIGQLGGLGVLNLEGLWTRYDDPQPKLEEIIAAERNVAHRIIEEFMLVANETVAQHLSDHGVPTLYRIHETPDPLRRRERDVQRDAPALGVAH